MADQHLQHPTFRGEATFYYYDGELPIKGGILTIPSGRVELLHRAWAQGYQHDPETGNTRDPEEVRAQLSA